MVNDFVTVVSGNMLLDAKYKLDTKDHLGSSRSWGKLCSRPNARLLRRETMTTNAKDLAEDMFSAIYRALDPDRTSCH